MAIPPTTTVVRSVGGATLPAIILAVVLALITVIVWVGALSSSGTEAKPVDCPAPPTPSATPDAPAPVVGTPADREEMLRISPAALSGFQIRVLNATDEQGKAQTVLDDLTSLGFQGTPEGRLRRRSALPDQQPGMLRTDPLRRRRQGRRRRAVDRCTLHPADQRRTRRHRRRSGHRRILQRQQSEPGCPGGPRHPAQRQPTGSQHRCRPGPGLSGSRSILLNRDRRQRTDSGKQRLQLVGDARRHRQRHVAVASA